MNARCKRSHRHCHRLERLAKVILFNLGVTLGPAGVTRAVRLWLSCLWCGFAEGSPVLRLGHGHCHCFNVVATHGARIRDDRDGVWSVPWIFARIPTLVAINEKNELNTCMLQVSALESYIIARCSHLDFLHAVILCLFRIPCWAELCC